MTPAKGISHHRPRVKPDGSAEARSSRDRPRQNDVNHWDASPSRTVAASDGIRKPGETTTRMDCGVRRYKLEPDPPVSETVRMIFDLRLAGASRLEIAAELNAGGARAPTVGRWRGQHVSRILSNEVYCGVSAASRQDMQDPDTAVRVPNAFPAIVSQEEFDRVQRMRGTAGS